MSRVSQRRTKKASIQGNSGSVHLIIKSSGGRPSRRSCGKNKKGNAKAEWKAVWIQTRFSWCSDHGPSNPASFFPGLKSEKMKKIKGQDAKLKGCLKLNKL